jgi:isopenicillin-N epimerase
MTHYGRALRDLWSLEENLHFLNHGSFGAVPRELFAVQNDWRARMEAQPVRFFMEELPARLREAAAALAAFVGTEPDRLGFVENASSGVSAVVGSLTLAGGDEILTTDHVYNAVRNRLRHAASQSGARVIEVPIGLPVATPDAIADAIAAATSERTRLLVIDHVASASAVLMPVARIVARAQARGVPVLIDGAHAPGMLDLDIDAIGADWYVGNCHKWLCAPKGAGFIAVGCDPPFAVHPTVISHAYGQGFTAEFDKVGTRDPSAWLAVPAAIGFHERLGGAALRARNAGLARAAGMQLADGLGTECGAPPEMFGAMATVRLPWDGACDRAAAGSVHDALWRGYRIEVPVMPFAGQLWLRLSAQAYNDRDDYDALAAALPQVLHAAVAA